MQMENVEDFYPLSPTQQGMLFHTLYAPQAGAYIEQLSYIHRGLDPKAFERAWQLVVDRHPVLRTSFVWEGLREPVQVVHHHVNLPLEQHDWQGVSPVEQQSRLESFLQRDQTRGFELTNVPLMRLASIQIAEDTCQIVWSHHHLLLDGWAVLLVLKGVFAFYEAIRRGQSLSLNPSRPYHDYIAWQRQQDLGKAETFWRRALKGVTAPTSLAVEQGPGNLPSQETVYDDQQIQLSTATTAALQSLARQHHLTLNTLVQGAWALLLSRYSDNKDVVFGVVVSGRPTSLAGVESMVGLFINTLPTRVQVSSRELLLPWLEKLQNQQSEMRQYECSALVQVQEWSNVPRGTPLFDSILIFENYPIDASLRKTVGNLDVTHIRVVGWTNYPLTVLAMPGPPLSVRIKYDCCRFDASTIEWMLRHLRTLLEGFVAHPDQQLSNLRLFTKAERRRHSTLGNLVRPTNSFAKFRKEEIEQSIPERFEQQVDNYPENIAVRTQSHEWTYEALNRVANRIAHAILSQHDQENPRIALLFEHDAPVIAGILGALKANRTYVPLDPLYPKDRTAYMLEDSQASTVLTNNANLALAEELMGSELQLINIDDVHPAQYDNIGLTIPPDALAYILYTSGSTKQSKGVMQSHRNVLHHIRAYTNALHIGESDRLTLLSSYSFDAAIMDVFGALLNGATVYPIDIKREGLIGLSEWLIEQEITIYHSTPTVYRYFVDTLSGGMEFPKLRCVVLGGEEVHKKDVDSYKKVFSPQCIFVNGLGPTESTLALQCFVNKQTEISRNTVPVGYPIEDTEVLLLNRDGEPTEIYGEIAIRSPYVALGYWQRLEETRAVFLPDPEGGSKRIYRTGDMGCLLPDGCIGYAGRRDTQVKIRGYKVEVSEIETGLLEIGGIKEAAVLAQENEVGEKRLVAFLVPANQRDMLSVGRLRSFLREKFPDYMVPSDFVMLDAMPLTPSGKADRRTLPKLDGLRLEVAAAYMAPRTQIQRSAAVVWREVLGVHRVGIHDNFFDLGGHSLLMVQAQSRLQQTLNRDISLVQLFQHPTISSLAEFLSQEQETSPSIQRIGDRVEKRKEARKRRKETARDRGRLR